MERAELFPTRVSTDEKALRKQLVLARSELARLRLERDLNELRNWSARGELVARGALIVWGASRVMQLKPQRMLAGGMVGSVIWPFLQRAALRFGSRQAAATSQAEVAGQAKHQ